MNKEQKQQFLFTAHCSPLLPSLTAALQSGPLAHLTDNEAEVTQMRGEGGGGGRVRGGGLGKPQMLAWGLNPGWKALLPLPPQCQAQTWTLRDS